MAVRYQPREDGASVIIYDAEAEPRISDRERRKLTLQEVVDRSPPFIGIVMDKGQRHITHLVISRDRCFLENGEDDAPHQPVNLNTNDGRKMFYLKPLENLWFTRNFIHAHSLEGPLEGLHTALQDILLNPEAEIPVTEGPFHRNDGGSRPRRP